MDYTDTNGNTRVAEYRANAAGTQALLRTRKQWLFVAQPYPNHNGGQLAFGRDGRLYVGMGDGGAGGDPQDRAQSMGTLLGKLVRINVAAARPGRRSPRSDCATRGASRSTARPATSTSATSARTPGRRSTTCRGHASPSSRTTAGTRTRGARGSSSKQPNSRGRLVFPVHVYGRGDGCSVTGGFVYRGAAVPAARGRYFFGDYCSGSIWSLVISGGQATDVRRESVRVPGLSSFGEDARGELYATSLEGRVYRFVR